MFYDFPGEEEYKKRTGIDLWKTLRGLFAVTPIQIALREHMRVIQKFADRVSEITPKGAELTPHD